MDATPLTPEPPPEAELIRQALTDRRLSVRQAAMKAKVSDTWFRNILRGSQPVAGMHVPVKGTADKLARMAKAVGVTPAQLRDAGRTDAAEDLERLTGAHQDAQRPPEQPASHSTSYASNSRIDAIAALLADLPPEAQEEVLRRVSRAQPSASPAPAEEAPDRGDWRRHAG